MSNIVQFSQPEEALSSHINLEAEQAFLGALMVNNDCLKFVKCGLGPEHFSEPVHSRIFDAAQEIIAQGRLAGPVTLKNKFDADQSLAEIGGSQYLARLAASATTILNAPEYAYTIVENYFKRQSSEAAKKYVLALGKESQDGQSEARSELDVAHAALDQLRAGPAQKTETTLGAAFDALNERLNDIAVHGVVEDVGCWPGSDNLKDAIGQFRRGLLYLLAGRPSMGKSTVALSWLIQASRKGAGVLLFSPEMKSSQLAARAASDISFDRYDFRNKIEYRRINNADVTDKEREKLLDATREFSKCKFKVHDGSQYTIVQIRAKGMLYKQELAAQGKRLDILCVDHLGLVKASDRYKGNVVMETEEISKSLKALAKDLDCAVIAIAQLNRSTEAQEDKRPNLASFRWSGSIEQDADVVLFCYRRAYYLERTSFDDPIKEEKRGQELQQYRNEIEIIVAKNRDGECNTLRFFCDMGCNAIRDLAA